MAIGSVVASWGEGGETAGAEVSVATARPGEVVIAVSAAVLLHAVVFVLLFLLALAEILIDSRRDEVQPEPPASEEAAVVELSANYFELVGPTASPPPQAVPPVVPPEPAAPSAEKPFLDTSEEQASDTPPEEAAFIGERMTRAGAELPPDPEGPALPSQDGEEARRNELELFNSEFSPGEEPGERELLEVEPERLAGQERAENGESEGSPGENEMTEPVEAGQPAESLITGQEQIPVPRQEGQETEETVESLPQGDRSESESELARQGEQGTAQEQVEEQPRERGFQTEAAKTRIRGSINRRGESSLDVDDTVIGRYRAKVYRAIETEWQLQCLQYRNHILPGSLALRFFVDKDANVLNPRYTYEFEASGIQRGFTLNAVRQARIPPMPKEVVEELEGKPMECEVGFNF